MSRRWPGSRDGRVRSASLPPMPRSAKRSCADWSMPVRWNGSRSTATNPFPAPTPNSRRRCSTRSSERRRPASPRRLVRGFDPILLDGVTGSGKTEVYFEAIAEAVRQGRQVLVLLPEIALTEPFLTRFSARFGCEPGDLAFGPPLVAAPPRLAGDRQGRSAGRGRGPLVAVPALSQPRPDRGRRGA